VEWTLTGHSERRVLNGETDAEVGAKTKLAVDSGLSAIACIGESLADREAGSTMEVVETQLTAIKDALGGAEHWATVAVAYEPVWAIGTGVVASPDQVQEVHGKIRLWLQTEVSADAANATRIIYGGSVKGGNCEELIQLPDVDGFLVGGAALTADFVSIVNCTRSKQSGL
jgi:triosephosphate isomerase